MNEAMILILVVLVIVVYLVSFMLVYEDMNDNPQFYKNNKIKALRLIFAFPFAIHVFRRPSKRGPDGKTLH